MGFSDGDGWLGGWGSSGSIFGKGGIFSRGVEISVLGTFPGLSAELTRGLLDLVRSITIARPWSRTSYFRFSRQGAQMPIVSREQAAQEA